MEKAQRVKGAAKIAMACRWKPALRDSVKAAAAATGISVNAFVEQALEEKLAAAQPGPSAAETSAVLASEVHAIRHRIESLDKFLDAQAPSAEEARRYADEVRASAESVRNSTDRIMNDLAGSMDGFKRGQECLGEFSVNLEATKKLLVNLASCDKNLSTAIAGLAETPKVIASKNRRAMLIAATTLVGCAFISAFLIFPSPTKIADFCRAGVKTALASSAKHTEVARR